MPTGSSGGSGSSSSGSGSAELEATYFALGILLAFIGNIGLNVGTNLIALGHDQKAKGRTIGKEWVGPSGLALYILGACVSFSSWAFGSQIVIAAFGSVQFVSNVFCARLFFGMPVTGKVVLSTLMIVVGNVLVILPPYISGVGGGHPSAVTGDPPGAEMLFMLYGKSGFQIYAIIACVIVMWMQKEYDRVVILEEQTLQPIPFQVKRLQMYRYICISGFVGSTATTLSKSCAGMLVVTIGDWNTNNQFLHSFTYIILLGWIYAMTTWVKRMDNALRMFDSFAVVILQLVWTLYSIVQGGIYYREFEPYGEQEYAFLALGLVLVCLGVYGLSPGTGGQGGDGTGSGFVPVPEEDTKDEDMLYDVSLASTAHDRVVAHRDSREFTTRSPFSIAAAAAKKRRSNDLCGAGAASTNSNQQQQQQQQQQPSQQQMPLPGGLPLPGGDNSRPVTPLSPSDDWTNSYSDAEQAWQHSGVGSCSTEDPSSLTEIVRQVNERVNQSSFGKGFGNSMPMHIMASLEHNHSGSIISSPELISGSAPALAGSAPALAGPLLGQPSLAQMHRRMRASVTAERGMLALSNRASLDLCDPQMSPDGNYQAAVRPASAMSNLSEPLM